jgi:hypothetical protein
MGSRQPDDAPGGVLVLNVAPATPSSSALPDGAPDLPDNVTLFTRHYTRDFCDADMVNAVFYWRLDCLVYR